MPMNRPHAPAGREQSTSNAPIQGTPMICVSAAFFKPRVGHTPRPGAGHTQCHAPTHPYTNRQPSPTIGCGPARTSATAASPWPAPALHRAASAACATTTQPASQRGRAAVCPESRYPPAMQPPTHPPHTLLTFCQPHAARRSTRRSPRPAPHAAQPVSRQHTRPRLSLVLLCISPTSSQPGLPPSLSFSLVLP